MINYSITPNTNSRTYSVSMTFNAKKKKHILKLPVWIPGSYMVREFSKNIIKIEAKQAKKVIDCQQTEKNTWVLSNLAIGMEIIVNYTVYAYEFGIRTAYLDFTRGYFNNTSICLCVDGEIDLEHKLMIRGLPKNWKVATGLKSIGKNSYIANNYDELIDCPVEIGTFCKIEFSVKGHKHYFVLSGIIHENFDSKRFINDVRKICETEIDLFGGEVPYESYTFILNLSGEIFTGLEHRNSTLLMAPYYSLPITGIAEINDDYLKLLGLISHEFFHTWNVKRIKPQVLNPYNLHAENYTKLLWWFEGITSYYDDLILFKSGLIDKKRYLGLITDNINSVYKYSGVTKQTLTNSSLTCWIKYYRQDDNSPNALVSYYVKGALVGMCLDLLIRDKTKNKSLDDVILGLFKKWQSDGLGITEDEIPTLIKEYSGCNLSKEIKQFIDTYEDLPIKELLSKFGVIVHTVAKSRNIDIGKVVNSLDEIPIPSKLDLGCKLTKDTIGYKINYVYNNSIAELSGIAANDIIIAINDIKLTDFDKQIALYKINSNVNLTFFRQERLINVDVKLKEPNFKIHYLSIESNDKLSQWLS